MKTASKIIASIMATLGIASRANFEMTPVTLVNVPAPSQRRKRGLRTGIKGIKSTNFTAQGASLQAHFDKVAHTKRIVAIEKRGPIGGAAFKPLSPRQQRKARKEHNRVLAIHREIANQNAVA